MRRFSGFFPYLVLGLVAVFFFQKTIFTGLVPFPGDLLVSEYQPWRSQSFLGYIAGSIPQKAQYFDTLRQLYPWKTLTIDTYKSGQFPLWNPYNFSGAPLLANNQSAVLYPLNIAFGIFSQIQAWTILVMLQPILASFFTYLYSRRVSMSIAASLLSAVAYGYSLYMSVFWEYNTLGHVILWLPLTLWAIESGKLGIFGVSIVAPGFAGHLQLFIVSSVFILFYLLFRAKNIIVLFRYLIIFILSLGIGAIQHIPTWELVAQSARVSHPYQYLVNTLLIQPQQLLKLISPDIFGNPAARNYLPDDSYPSKALYIGLIPLILALTILLSRKKNHVVRLFFITILFLLLVTVRTPISEYIYRFPIPFLSTSSPTNALFLLSFSLAVLAGFGLDNLRKLNIAVPCIAIGAILVFSWSFTIQKNNLIYTTLLFCLTFVTLVLRKYRNKLATIALLLFTVFDLFYFFNKFNPFVPSSLAFPNTKVTDWLKDNAGIDRFWGYGTAAIASNVGTQFGIFSPDGYDPLYPKRYGELMLSGANGMLTGAFTNQTRSDAVIVPGFGELDLPSNPYRLRLMELLGVRYVLDRTENGSTQKTFPPDLFSLHTKIGDWTIFEYKKALPRAYLASSYETYSSPQQFEKRFFDPSFDPKSTLLLEEDPKLPAIAGNPNDVVRLVDYQPNRVVFKTSTASDKLLFFSDTYFPGWIAAVDQQPTKIFRSFYTFRAVVVPKGNHTISFSYKPQSFLLGGKVTIISMILFIIAIYALPKAFASYYSHHRVGSPVL